MIDAVQKIKEASFTGSDGLDYVETLVALDALKSVSEQEPCEDAISRQAVLDAINNICPVDTEYDCTLLDRVDVRYVLSDLPPVTPQYTDAEIQKMQEMEQAEIQKAYEIDKAEGSSEWIPVSETVPETAGVYIVTRRLFDNQIDSEPYYMVDACFFDESNTWHNDNRINHDRNYLTDIIAWMPKPEPYKAESEN